MTFGDDRKLRAFFPEEIEELLKDEETMANLKATTGRIYFAKHALG